MAQAKKGTTIQKSTVKDAARAVTALRKTIGLPTEPLAREIATRLRQLSIEKNALIEWDIRVLRPGEEVEALCNCHCYA
jgi:hypothetical protein